jgi:hypothetical protein
VPTFEPPAFDTVEAARARRPLLGQPVRPQLAGTGPTYGSGVDDRYLSLGLAGMVNAGEPFMAHFGAALLAGWWIERDLALTPDASRAMVRQADALIGRHSWLFADLRTSAAVGRAHEIVEAIEGGLDHTWAVGHDVIYAALVARTLDARPELDSGPVVDGVIAVLEECRTQPLDVVGGVFDVRDAGADEVGSEEVATNGSLAAVALGTVLEFDHVYLGLHQGDIGHLADHAHALIVLDRLGHAGIAQRGRRGFREHLAALRRVRHSTADLPEIAPSVAADARDPAYWDRSSSSNDWAVGHVFKYPYAMFDLLEVSGSPELARPVMTRLGQLVADGPGSPSYA